MMKAIIAAVIIGMGLIAYIKWTPAPKVSVYSAANIADEASAIIARDNSVAIETAKTFRGANEDGALRTLSGHLLVDRDLRRWIDFHLSATGELSLEDIVNAMQIKMRALPVPANSEALDLLARYLTYRQDIDNYDALTARKIAANDSGSLTARVEWMENLRRLYFDEKTIGAFFGLDEHLDRYTLEKLALMQSGASADDLALLDEALPLSIRVQREQARTLNRLDNINERFALDTQALKQQRALAFGPEAAERLQRLDEQRADWKHRLQAYQSYKVSVEDEFNAAQLIELYADEYFSSSEKLRLEAASVSVLF